MKKLLITGAAIMTIVATAGSLSAQTALKDVAKIRDGIIYAGMAYEISEQCPSISARLFRGIGYLNSLKNHASELGYSDAEIDAYIDDDAEKDRLEALARQQLTSMGAVSGDPASYCAVGRAQMDANTRVGWLLR